MTGKHLRNFLIGTSILGALTLSNCSSEKPTTPKPPIQTNETAWLVLEGNSEKPWTKDKRMHPEKYSKSKYYLSDIYTYYNVHGKVPVERIRYTIDVEAFTHKYIGESVYIEVPESKADSLIIADGFVRYNGFNYKEN